MIQKQKYVNPLECSICKLNCRYKQNATSLIASGLKIKAEECYLFKIRLQQIKNQKQKKGVNKNGIY